MSRKRSNGTPNSRQFVVDREQRIAEQKLLIAELQRKGRSTAQAEAELRRELLALTMLRNHFAVITELTINPYEDPLGPPTVQRTVVARNRDG